jgi:hypothetical protein
MGAYWDLKGNIVGTREKLKLKEKRREGEPHTDQSESPKLPNIGTVTK